jgi:hypothetical protein
VSKIDESDISSSIGGPEALYWNWQLSILMVREGIGRLVGKIEQVI